jgi:hypothetical protein
MQLRLISSSLGFVVTVHNNDEYNTESKKNKNWDTDLHGSIMCLCPHEYDYISLTDLGLQHNILIRKP